MPSGVQVLPTPLVAFGSNTEHASSRASVAPFPAPIPSLSRNRTSLLSRFSSFRNALEPTVRVGPTKQRGRVSIERLLALREYTARTSTTRAIIVCLLTPVPALVIALAIESIPLAPPATGWRGQGMFWLRLLLTAMLMIMSSGIGFKKLAGRALELSMIQLSAITLLAASLYVSFFVGVAAMWTFPIPFLFVIGGVPFVVAEISAAFAVVDVRAVVAKVEGLKKRTDGINSVSSAVSMLFWIYPLYSVAFEHVGPKYQVSLLLVLPIFKIQWKRRMCAKLIEVEDLIPAIMMFTIELFNSLYLVTCMQSSGSPLTTVAIILIDTLLGFIRMHRLHEQMASLRNKVESWRGSPDECDLLKQSIDRLTDPATTLTNGVLATLRIRGNGLENDLSVSSASLLSALEVRRKDELVRREAGNANSRREAEPLTAIVASAKPDDTALNETLLFLFQCEFMMLAEYIECAIPLLYVVYLTILRRLHNGVFFGHIHSLSDDDLHNAVVNIVVYAALEFVSLVVTMLWLRRHFAVSVLHVLAFVLDKYVWYVQSNVIIQILFALQFTIAHLGADFSFRFAWLKDPSVTWWIRK